LIIRQKEKGEREGGGGRKGKKAAFIHPSSFIEFLILLREF
jgi:ribosomal protein L19E